MDTAVVLKQKNIELTPEIEERILSSQTRQCNKVIQALYGCRLSNKELAESIGVSSSALSNILQKIKSNQLGLLVVTQNGRNTFYSLSELGAEYAEKHLFASNVNDKVINIEEKLSEFASTGIQALRNIQTAWEDEWQLKLDEQLYEYVRTKKCNEENFENFMEAIRNIIIEERWEELNKIYSFLENDILRRRIEKCFEDLMEIKNLCIIDSMDWKLAYRMVDGFFQNDEKKTWIGCFKQIQKYELNNEMVFSCFDVLKKIVQDAEENKLTKEEVFDRWERLFVPHEKLIYYIADKYVQYSGT